MTKLYALTIIFFFCTQSIHAQCLDEDAHNTSLNNMWLSCESFPNPLGELGNNHWLLYEFDELQSIESMKIWNANHPDYLDAGIKSLRIDYSPDGANWTQLGTTELSRADGGADYTGEDVELDGFKAKFVLLTSIENHGSACTGLAEIKFNIGELSTATEETYLSSLISISPNPADQSINISLGDFQTQDISYQLVDATGKILLRNQSAFRAIQDGFSLSAASLPDGHYTLQMQTDIGTASKQIIILHAK